MSALDDANPFLRFLIEHRALFQGSRQSFPALQEEIHCSKCGGRRRVELRVLYAPPMPPGDYAPFPGSSIPDRRHHAHRRYGYVKPRGSCDCRPSSHAVTVCAHLYSVRRVLDRIASPRAVRAFLSDFVKLTGRINVSVRPTPLFRLIAGLDS
jgi:hypothetical protein